MRVIATKDLEQGTGAPISLRDNIEPDTIWFHAHGCAFGIMEKADRLRLRYEGNWIEGGRVNR